MASVIKRPLVSEKNSILAEVGVYAFEVTRAATKTEVKKAIETNFKVKVVSVNTSICRGRSKRAKNGMSQPQYWKKALVKLAAGEKIGLFEGA